MWASGDIGHWVKRGICHGSVTCGFCGGVSLDLVHGVVKVKGVFIQEFLRLG